LVSNPCRRSFLVGLGLAAATPALAARSPENDALIAKAVEYLDGLSSAQSRFTQSDARGREATGTLWLARPGRARFQYDPPSGYLITSDGKTVTVSDSRLKSVQRFPLNSTPLGVFLAQHIRLDHGAHVTRVDRSADGFSITARDSRGLSQGDITLYFTNDPIRLIGWVVIDAQARMTRVTLEDLKPTPTPDSSLFTQLTDTAG
jgi:outer membrane lipoprotein-sorting protein